jgi:hypothetical protein
MSSKSGSLVYQQTLDLHLAKSRAWSEILCRWNIALIHGWFYLLSFMCCQKGAQNNTIRVTLGSRNESIVIVLRKLYFWPKAWRSMYVYIVFHPPCQDDAALAAPWCAFRFHLHSDFLPSIVTRAFHYSIQPYIFSCCTLGAGAL